MGDAGEHGVGDRTGRDLRPFVKAVADRFDEQGDDEATAIATVRIPR